jgi:hypothetical protein
VRDAVRSGAIVEDPYAVLGIRADASAEAIRQAYRSKARTCHPDVTREPHAAARFRRLAAAYEILGDPARRRAYDARRGAIASSASEGSPRPGPVAVHRAPRPTGVVVTPRAVDVRARAAEAVAPPRSVRGPSPAAADPVREASMDEWRLLSIVGRAAAAVVLLAIVGVIVIALLSAARDDPTDVPTPFCRTPDGWIDCRRVIDPLTP